MRLVDPALLAIGLGLLAGPLGAALARRRRRALGAALAAAAGAGLAALGTSGLSGEPPALVHALLAGAAGGAAALALPGLGVRALRRRSFGAAYGHAAFTGARGSARLPARSAGRPPSALLDAADRLRLESVLCEVERKSGAEPAVALVARAAEHEDARGRAGAWLAALALCGALAFAAPPLAALGAAAAGMLAGRALTRAPRARRFFVAESALDESAFQGAFDAFAQAGLLRAPRQLGALVFLALGEGRAIVLLGRGLPGRLAEPMARTAADGLAAGRPLEGLRAALDLLASPDPAPSDEIRAPAASPLPRPHPVRVED